MMLSSLGVGFRRTTKICIADPEDITETARSTRHGDFDDTNANDGRAIGALIEEVGLVVSEDRRRGFAQKVGNSFRKMQGVSFRRAKSSQNLMRLDEQVSTTITDQSDAISMSNLCVPIRTLADATGSDTLEKLGWSLRRPNTFSRLMADESAVSVEKQHNPRETVDESSVHSMEAMDTQISPDVADCQTTIAKGRETAEAIETNKKDSLEGYITLIVPDSLLNEQTSKCQGLPIDKEGDAEIFRPKAFHATSHDKLLDADAARIEPEVVAFRRKASLTVPCCSIALPVLSEACRFRSPNAAQHPTKVETPLAGLEPCWPTADGIDPVAKIVDSLEGPPTRQKSGRRKLKRTSSNDSSLGSSFKRVLAFRTVDSNKICSDQEESHRRGLFRIRSCLSSCASLRLVPNRSKSTSALPSSESNFHSEPVGQATKLVDLNPFKREERKAILALLRTKSATKKCGEREVVKKAKSLQWEHEGLACKSGTVLERQALMSRLVRRAVSFPIHHTTPSSVHDKTVEEDEQHEFLLEEESRQHNIIPVVYVVVAAVNRDAMSAVSSIGFPDVPGIVECTAVSDLSVVSSLGNSRCGRPMAMNEQVKVPSIIKIVHSEDLQDSLDYSFSGSNA